MLLFSVNKGNLLAGIENAERLSKGIEFAVHFNVLAVIVLAEPADQFSNSPSHEGPEAFGADSAIQWPEEQECEEENEGEKPDKEFLL